eukprot:scaffold63172_cov27-Tisochrysis_lutea.AAC.3
MPWARLRMSSAGATSASLAMARRAQSAPTTSPCVSRPPIFFFSRALGLSSRSMPCSWAAEPPSVVVPLAAAIHMRLASESADMVDSVEPRRSSLCGAPTSSTSLPGAPAFF